MAKFRKPTRLSSRLSSASTPVVLIGRDRKILFFNHGCEALTGWTADDVLGKVCEYVTHPDSSTVDALLGSLCPPPRVFEGESVEAPAFLPLREGRPVARTLQHVPLLNDAGEVDCVLVLISPLKQPNVITTTSPAQRLHAELTAVRSQLRQRFGTGSIIAKGEAMLRVVQQVQLAISSRSALMLEGEPGTGKEHLARVIHHESDFRHWAFVPLDCARLLPIDLKRTLRRLIQADRPEAATSSAVPSVHPGTVYLKHVDAMPRDVQEFLVTALAERTDSEQTLRFIACTSANLETLVSTEALRADFFYLLTPIRISLPPLRQRSEDLELLAQSLLERLNRGANRQLEGLAEEVWQEFREYNWPGNLDELATVIEESRRAGAGVIIQRTDLPFRFRTGRDAQSVGPRREPLPRPLEPFLEQVEREQIEWALGQARHNKKKAADLLGLTRPKLYRRMEALGIEDTEDGPTA